MGLYSGLTRFGLFLLATTFLSCNQPPDTFVTKQFKENGEVEYTFSGEDIDGYINSIDAFFNDSAQAHSFGDGGSSLVPIILGTNKVKAIAWDDDNACDETPAEDSFYSLTQEEAEEAIDVVFGERVEAYKSLEKKALICLGASDDFHVDYLVRKTDDTDAIVNYVGYAKNLEDELANSELLGLYGIPNLYIIRVPEDEMRLRLNGFIDKGFND